MGKIVRASRDDVLMENAVSWSKRATCLRKSVGAVFAKEGRPIISGYNGAPSGMPHCLDEGCIIGPHKGCVRCNHAEANAISWAARKGLPLEGSTLYVTVSPCENCAMLLINLGLERVVYLEEYRDKSGLVRLKDSGITIHHYEDIRSLYGFK